MRLKIPAIIAIAMLMVPFRNFAQTFAPAKGTVLSEGGVPLSSVSIKWVDKQTLKTGFVLSDSAGRFELQRLIFDHPYNLFFSYVGYKDDSLVNFVVREGDNSSILMRLKEDQSALKDIVIVGYGTQAKTDLTGAVVQISGKVLEDRPLSRLSQGLQGAVANLNITTQSGGGAPNATQAMNIRGYTGLGTSGSPLVVIDGVQGGDINAINPNDVASITVVKDAAAAAVYGSSAPYGVILITTKKGKAGEKSTITYNNNINHYCPGKI